VAAGRPAAGPRKGKRSAQRGEAERSEGGAGPSQRRAPQVFAGLRVLDCTQGLAGPLAGMHFADFGADVLKIEGPGGDRSVDRPAYHAFNRNKRRVVLDLASPEGARELRELVRDADVVLLDASADELAAHALDAACLCPEHPRLIHVWMPPYGDGDGAREAGLPPSELLLSGLTGTAFSQFSWEDVPVHLVTPQLAYAQGLLGAVVTAAALFERLRSGLGQAVVATGYDALAITRGGTAAVVGELERRPARGALGNTPAYRLYRCGDGEWLFLGTLLLPHFRLAIDALGVRDLLALPGVEGRVEVLRTPALASTVRERIAACFAAQPRAHWLERLAAAGVPCGPVGSRAEWFASEQVRAVGMRVELEARDGMRVALPGVSVELSESPGRVVALLEDAGSGGWRAAPAPDVRPSTHAASEAPLAGVRVLELGQIIAGPFAACLLAGLGADVIKIEPPAGDGFRAFGRAFVGYNQGKRSLVLDLREPRDRAVLDALIARSDVVCENYRLGVAERLGIDPARLARINPRIVSASITGYGTRGPLASDPGFDPLLQARSGLMREQGGDDAPVFHQIPINDVASAAGIAFGVIAALIRREQSGRGQRVETSLAAQSVLTQSDEMTEYDGRPPAVRGCRDCPGVRALERFYRCEDGWIALDASEPRHVESLARALGLGVLDVRTALAARRDGALAQALAERFAAGKRDAWVVELAASAVPVAPVRTFQELLAEPALLRDDFFVTWEHPQFGAIQNLRRIAHFSRTPCEHARRAPLLGEHDAEILRSLTASA
jgi:crotonobetainyl-CoA:carnitine CoA-transferase CaiB-like acyl-CoA transferase